jgi:hypothetical protein
MRDNKTLEELLAEISKKLDWLIESKEYEAEVRALESEGCRNVR